MLTDQHVTSAAGHGAMSATVSAIGTSPRRQRGAGANSSSRIRARSHDRAISRRARAGRLDGEQVAELVSAAALGDASAWDELVSEFGGLVRSIARSHRLNDADAADAAQATWLLLFQHLHQINDPARLGAWLVTTTRRECLRVLRGAQRYVTLEDELDCGASTEAPADSAVLAAERDLAVRRCFDRLRATDQQLLMLLIADEQPGYAEISVTLEMPVGSIGPTRARALDRLRSQLASDGSLALFSA
jgi:RNA polymerase sigma factor (sigma-70 family)